MDMNRPMEAADFVTAGADPSVAADLAAQHNQLSGRGSFNDKVALAQSFHNLPPPAPAAPARTSNAQLADATVEHQDVQLVGQMDATFAPPAQPYDYQFPTPDNATDEQLASDSAIKTAFHAAQMPKLVVDSIASSLAEAARTRGNETPAQEAMRIESQKSRLIGMWGKDNFAANMRTVDNFIEQTWEKNPALRAIDMEKLTRSLSPLDLDLILQTAKYRAGKKI
jgi:hypothetical protein